MAKQLNHSLLRSNKYKLSVIIILLLASCVWLFFSIKILQYTPDIELIKNSTQQKSNGLISNIEKTADLRPSISRSRNRENSRPLNETEKQQYIEALRESFERVNPTKNNKIIRGDISPSIKELADKPSTNLESLLNNKFELKRLNTEYQKALKGINTKP